jgi:hypothetical protein
MTSNSVKILLVGDCNGAFKTLFAKVAVVNKKNGPFDAVFCVGSFFATGGARNLGIRLLFPPANTLVILIRVPQMPTPLSLPIF